REDRRDQERVHGEDRAPGDVAPGIHRLLGGERHLLDGQEEPDRERQRLEDPTDAEGEDRTASPPDLLEGSIGRKLAREVRPQGEVELPRDDGGEEEERQDRDRQYRDGHREPHGGLDADDVDADEDDVEDGPPERKTVPP